MKARTKAFSLVELLTTISIVAVLSAVLAPVFASCKKAFFQQQAMFGLKQVSFATSLYLADNEDTYPLGMNRQPDGSMRTWFGAVSTKNEIDTKQGALSTYLGSNQIKDPTAPKLAFLGNGSGFGYNYETLGSDLTETNDFSRYPDCFNAAAQSGLSEPAATIAFGTSVVFRPVWTKGGDNQTYEFGFITPPWAWNGNPTISFRHQGERKLDVEHKTTWETGNALVLFADGRAKALRRGEVTDKLFVRNPASFATN